MIDKLCKDANRSCIIMIFFSENEKCVARMIVPSNRDNHTICQNNPNLTEFVFPYCAAPKYTDIQFVMSQYRLIFPCSFQGLWAQSAQFGPAVETRPSSIRSSAPQHTLPSSSSWTGLHPSLVLRGRQWDQGALLRAVALLPVLLLVLEVQYDPFDPPVIRGGRATLLLHLSCRLLPLLLFLAPLYGRGHYVIKEGEEAIDPIRALLS